MRFDPRSNQDLLLAEETLVAHICTWLDFVSQPPDGNQSAIGFKWSRDVQGELHGVSGDPLEIRYWGRVLCQSVIMLPWVSIRMVYVALPLSGEVE
jgi:hypothetical protein